LFLSEKITCIFPLRTLVALHVKVDTEVHLLYWQLLSNGACSHDSAFQGLVPAQKSLIGLVCTTRTLNILPVNFLPLKKVGWSNFIWILILVCLKKQDLDQHFVNADMKHCLF
jgi:hypothetical protein